jgi:hypothetical protein
MSIASEYLAAAPKEWRRDAHRLADPTQTLSGLFRTDMQHAVFGQSLSLPDPTPHFEVVWEDALAFNLVSGDVLSLDGRLMRVVDIGPVDDFGISIVRLRVTS